MKTERIAQIQLYNRIYNIVMAGLQGLALLCFGLIVLISATDTSSDEDFVGFLIMLCCMLIFIIPAIILFVYLSFAIEQRSKFVYYANIASLALGFTGLLTIIPAVILFVMWIDKDVKDYYLKTGEEK